MDDAKKYSIISVCSFCVAIIFCAIYNQWILFRIPWSTNEMVHSVIQKKHVVHHYFHADKWKTEKQEILWHDTTEKNIFHLLNAWLVLLDEERITPKKTTVQSVLISGSGTAYLSFDHNILAKEEIIFKKWMVMEGLLKTIASNDIPITHVQFLVQHSIVRDAHLDFSLAWPVQGFIKN